MPHADRDRSEPRNVCGHVMPALSIGGERVAPPHFCDRREGHEGAHTDGVSWWTPGPKSRPEPTLSSEQPVWPPHARAAYLDEPVPYVPAESADKHGDCERCYWKGRTVAAEHEVERLKMGLWDAWVALGHDTDGDTGPGAFIAGMGIGGFIRMVIDDATTWRRESEEDYAADTDRLEGRIARAKAMHKVDEFGLCIECRQGFPCDTVEALDGVE